MATRINPAPGKEVLPRLPEPTVSGNWLRLPDGGVQPADEATATRAGLPWSAPANEQPE
jgi:hypothetical protein